MKKVVDGKMVAEWVATQDLKLPIICEFCANGGHLVYIGPDFLKGSVICSKKLAGDASKQVFAPFVDKLVQKERKNQSHKDK